MVDDLYMMYIDKIFSRKDLTTSEKLVLIFIFGACEDGPVQISQAEIAKSCGCSDATIRRSLKSLEIKYLVLSAKNFDDEGGREANSYIVNRESI